VRSKRAGAAAVAVVAFVAGAMAALPAGGAAPARQPPKVRHVFIIVLENENYADSFGPNTKAPYLAKKLTAKGELMPNYYGIGHLSLDNYIAMVSGQAPNPQTQADCEVFNDFLPGTPTSDGQYIGTGCVYPPGVETVANQLEGAGYAWHEYAQDMNARTPPNKPAVTCRHPSLNGQDNTQSAEVGDQYAARHNPFVYFHSIIEFNTCEKNVVDLTHLRGDLKHERTTPNYAFITPNLCNDGHDAPCVNGKPGGLKSADAFLKRRVPAILHSPAYQNRGLLMVLFDEADPGPGGDADATACCDEQPGPNTPNPGGPTIGPGGGKVGAVMLSPCIKPGTVNRTPYNHYSMLRSVEDNFGLSHLGYAGQQGLEPFGSKTLNRRTCGEKMRLVPKPGHAVVRTLTHFKLRVKAPIRRCRERVKVRFAHHRVFTNRHGLATIDARLHGAGRHFAAAHKPGCRAARATVNATAPR
jgi:hypothetical protein